MEETVTEVTSEPVMVDGNMEHHKHYYSTHHHYHKDKHKSKKEDKMNEPINLFTNPSGAGMGGAIGGGLGAGLLGGVLGGALLGGNGNGLFGNRGAGAVEGFVTPTQLQTGLNGVTETLQNGTILQTLGDIKASVPLAEAQVQLALAGVQNDITTQINGGNVALMQGQFAINKNVSDNTAQIIATEVATQNVVQNGIAAVNLGIANLATSGLQNTFALSQTIRDDGDRTRALISAQNDAMLNRQLAVAESALLEQRAINRGTVSEVNVTQTVNQNQLQAQSQLQTQQQNLVLNNIWSRLEGMQSAIATNSNLIIGNSGASTTGAQTSAPVNVR